MQIVIRRSSEVKVMPLLQMSMQRLITKTENFILSIEAFRRIKPLLVLPMIFLFLTQREISLNT